jgi:hypothetical protein
MFFREWCGGMQNTNKNPGCEILIISNDQNYTNKFISRTTCLSFPLVGNLSSKEGLRASRNDTNKYKGFIYGFFSKTIR